MKSPFRKLRGFGFGFRQHPQPPPPRVDELSQASQDLQDMKYCYDSLLSCAAAAANSAYEFSESLCEMGDCLLQKTSLNDDDEDTGKVLLMMGKVQFQIQNLLDNYRSHISRTITVPSESLLNELRVVEDMKRQCDQKRVWYDDIKAKHKERKRLGSSSKGEYVSSNQVRAAKEEFEEDAALFIFRMRSLKGGQSRSLLTQVTRHHAAQKCFFRKALKSLETIDPHVQLVTQQHHIDYQFSGLEDDDRDSLFHTDDEDESDDDYDDDDDSELTFDHQRNDPKHHKVSSSENSLKNVDLTFPQVAPLSSVKEQRKPLWNSSTYNIAANKGSKSAPLSARSNMDTFRQSSARKLNTYVLPTPVPRFHTQQQAGGMWHSSPLCKEKRKFSGSIDIGISKPTPLPCPIKPKRYAFSGPLAHSSGKSVNGGYVSSPNIKISELHELPRPPTKAGFSAPLLTFPATVKLRPT